MSSFENIRSLVAKVAETAPDTITSETQLSDLFDSLDYLTLEVEVYNEFPDLDREAEFADPLTVGDVVRIVDGALIATGEYCPICAEKFQPDDVCATDISEGTVHAACLECAPVVDLNTSEALPDGKLDTFRYGDEMDAEGHING